MRATDVGEVIVSGSVPGIPWVDIALGRDRRRLEVAARAERERQPRVLRLRPGQRAGRAGGVTRCRIRSRRSSDRCRTARAPAAGPPRPARARGPGPTVMPRIALSSRGRDDWSAARDVVLAALAGEDRPQVTRADIGGRPRRAVDRAARLIRREAVAVAVLASASHSCRSGRTRCRSESGARSPGRRRPGTNARPGRSPAGSRAGPARGSPASTTERWSTSILPLPRL